MKNKNRSKSFLLWAAILWTCLTLYASIMPSSNVKSISRFYFEGMDKVAHFVLYFVFSILWYKALTYIYDKNVIWLAVGFSIIFGITMEILQFLFFSDRSFEISDIIANIIGSFAGVIILKRIKF